MIKWNDKYYAFVLKDCISDWNLKKTNTKHDDTLKKITPAERIVFTLISDLRSRKGFRHQWEQIDDDIQDEIIDTWLKITNFEFETNE